MGVAFAREELFDAVTQAIVVPTGAEQEVTWVEGKRQIQLLKIWLEG